MQDSRFKDCLQEVLSTASSGNIQQFGCNGTCEDDWSKVVSKEATLVYRLDLPALLLLGRRAG